MTTCRFIPLTGPLPGAIAIIQLHGDIVPVLNRLTGVTDWPIGRARLVPLHDVDEGIAVRLDHRTAQLMPHGGSRVMQRLQSVLHDIGGERISTEDIAPQELYPEAIDRIEAIALAAVANAASPLALNALLTQPDIWRQVESGKMELTDEDHERSKRLNHLLNPPLVVLAGPPNVGKSTLSNALLGRSMSIAVDMPGTTRDYTTARIELAGLVVNWHDTPGLRVTDDPIESKAIELAHQLISGADLLLAMTDAEHDWPSLPRQPDLRIASKADRKVRDDADVTVSAVTGAGIADLVRLVRDTLVPPRDLDLAMERPWIFDTRLLHPGDD